MKRFVRSTLVLIVVSFQIQAQELAVSTIFGSSQFSSRGFGPTKWIESGERFSYQQFDTTTKQTTIYAYRLKDGTREVILDGSALRLTPGDPPLKFNSYQWSPDEKQILFVSEPLDRQYLSRLTPAGNFFLYDRTSKLLRQLTNSDVPQYNQKFSPDGTKLGFVRHNNIVVLDMASGAETQITRDGNENVINGKFDWVYEEEFGISDGWQWSPDGSSIAFWQLDQSREPEFRMVDYMSLRSDATTMRYPKAGDPNAIVKIGVVSLATGRIVWMDLGPNNDVYIPRMRWTTDGKSLIIHRLNRLQNTLELLWADSKAGTTRVFFTETEKTWIEEKYDLQILDSRKQFLWVSERDGYSHIFLFGWDGLLIRQVTRGRWDVGSITSVDEKRGVVYFTAAVQSPLERHLHRIGLDGSGLKQITANDGTHSPNISPNKKYFLDSFSNVRTPVKLGVFEIDGSLVRMIDENIPPALARVRFGTHSFFTFTTSDSVMLNGWMIQPSDLDPSKKYPVLMFVYGGPGSQTVTNSWGGANFLWYQMLAQKGYVVVSIDGRGTGNRGKEFKSIVYRKLGTWEVHDQVEGARYLGGLPFVDKNRIGIWGWSYGGYVAALSMVKGAGTFRASVAVAPVTDWRFYDTIYSERFMGLPQENKAGYDEAASISHASKFQGKLLIVHGTTDDNVHWQNTTQLVDALQKAGKQFETMFYVNKNHGIAGGNTRVHLYEMMTRFIEKNL